MFPVDANGDFDGALELGTPVDADTYDCATALIPSYLREMPIDPTSTYDATATGYYICQDTNSTVSRVYILSVGAEVFTDDGGCNSPIDTADLDVGDPIMCVSG